jgi:Icc protein
MIPQDLCVRGAVPSPMRDERLQPVGSHYKAMTTMGVVLRCGMMGLLCVAGCDIEIQYSPWQSNVRVSNLTAIHLEKLTKTDTGSFEPFTVAVASDVHVDAAELRDTVQALNARGDIAFLLLTGDLTDVGMLLEFTWLKDTIEECEFPVLTVVGNHDGISNGQDIYSEMFGPFNYSFVYRDVQFIMWNNNPYEWGNPDLEWLEQQVANHDPSVIVAHQPPPPAPTLEEDWKYIRQGGSVIATVHGHIHTFDYYLEDDAVPIYTVDTVRGGNYGLIEFGDSGLRFFNGSPGQLEEVSE